MIAASTWEYMFITVTLQKNSKEQYYMEQRCEDGVRIYSGICVRIIVSATCITA